VQVARAETRTTRITFTAQGEARPRTQATLAAQVGGRVVWTSPAFVDGGAFRQGDALLRLDDADAKLAVVRAKSQVAQANEALAREQAESDLARQDWEALGRGAPSPLVLREPQLAQAKAALAAAQAQLQGAELDLSRTTVRAPFTGRVQTRRVAQGDFVAPGSPVAVAFATDVVEVRIPLSDADLAALELPLGYAANGKRPAPIAHLSATVAGKDGKWEGRLTRTEAVVDPRTRLTYGIVEVPNPFGRDAPLAPGLFVTATIDAARQETFIAAPRGALKRNELIYVVGKDDTIDIRTVRAAQTTADEVFLRAGLAAGERVVVSTLPSARLGMKVTPIETAPTAGVADAAKKSR
jgi:RND family efflux transporter MFP subunit